MFNNCTIKPEDQNPTQLKGNDWTLARPWNKSPACTFLNTRMYTQPRTYGWNKMTTELVVRFHEYRSMDGAGNLLSLGTRSLAACSPAPGSDDCILSDELAKNYTIRNAMGGADAFEPNELCKQIDAASGNSTEWDENHEVWTDGVEVDDDDLTWNNHLSALCYFVFKLGDDGKWQYVANTTEASLRLTAFGTGYYCVRAANQRGGLGAASKTVRYELNAPYELQIKPLNEGDADGWSTICLPFNARIPEGVDVYAATAHNKTEADDKVEDFIMTLTPVSVIDAEKGYVVHGPVGFHEFHPTSRTCDRQTILTGNPTSSPISALNISCYVMANKSWGLGFYKFTGSTLAAYRAWLPQDMVSTTNQEALATGAKAIRFKFADTDGLETILYRGNGGGGEVYDLQGNRILTTAPQGVYIIRGKGKVMKKY